MFDVGFSELVLIGIVALLVLGPERLPKVARTAGLWAGRARRMVANVKADIDRELKAEELKQIMQKQAQSSGIDEIVEQTRSAVGEIRQAAQETANPAANVGQTLPHQAPATPTQPSVEVASEPAVTPSQAHDK